MKRLVWIIPSLLIVFGSLIIGFYKPGTNQSSDAFLSFNLCFKTVLSLEKVTLSPSYYNHYMDQYWVDSTTQFFLKTIVLNQEDTLMLSVFNLEDDKSIIRILNSQLDTTLSQQGGQIPLLTYFSLFGKRQKDWLTRYLLQDPAQRQNYFLIDLIQKDSIKAFRQYHHFDLNKILEKCR